MKEREKEKKDNGSLSDRHAIKDIRQTPLFSLSGLAASASYSPWPHSHGGRSGPTAQQAKPDKDNSLHTRT